MNPCGEPQLVAGIYLPASDTHFGAHISSSELVDGRGTYQLAKLRAALTHCRGRGLAVDVGAQVGLWTRVLAGEFNSVTAVEPVPEFAECLRRNTEHQDNVTILIMALGATTGRLPLRRYIGIASAQVCADDKVADLWAPTCRLDSLLLPRPIDFLKIDCEGAEHFVVEGGEQTIRRDRPTIIIEQKKRYVARYGLDKRQPTVKLLQSWGAVEYWARSGDHCVGWPE